MTILGRKIGSFGGSLKPFAIASDRSVQKFDANELGLEYIPQVRPLHVRVQLADHIVDGVVEYVVCAERNECAVLRATAIREKPNSDATVIAPWTIIYRFQGAEIPDSVPVEEDFDASIVNVMRAIRNVALGPV